MNSRLSVLLIVSVFLAACASNYGSEADARKMLEQVVTELKKDKALALAKFNKGEDGFKDRDLYPFCASEDGTVTAHPVDKGRDIKEVKDKNGKAFGQEMLQVAEEGKFVEVTYVWPKPGDTEPV